MPGAPEGPGPEPALADYSVALLNRGTPGSLVTPDGVLYISLMRACSAWPCGVWIDGDKRTLPDGSSFAWQHWSHTFEYALAAGPGDWRAAGFGLTGQDYNDGLLAVPAGRHRGPLPSAASLAGAAPATALISALKPRGNPLAPGRQPQPADGITVRLRDVSGALDPVRTQVRLWGGVVAANRTDLCEELDGPPVPVGDGVAEPELPPSGVVTLVLQTAPAQLPDAAAPAAPTAPSVPTAPFVPVTSSIPITPFHPCDTVHPCDTIRAGVITGPGGGAGPDPGRPSSPATGCRAAARPRPGISRWPYTSPPPGPPCRRWARARRSG